MAFVVTHRGIAGTEGMQPARTHRLLRGQHLFLHGRGHAAAKVATRIIPSRTPPQTLPLFQLPFCTARTRSV